MDMVTNKNGGGEVPTVVMNWKQWRWLRRRMKMRPEDELLQILP